MAGKLSQLSSVYGWSKELVNAQELQLEGLGLELGRDSWVEQEGVQGQVGGAAAALFEIFWLTFKKPNRNFILDNEDSQAVTRSNSPAF